MSATDLVRRTPSVSISARDMDPVQLGDVLARSGFFQDSRDAAQAAVKVMAGAEIGFGPVASMTGINIINGRVTLSANLMAAAIKAHPRYSYRVTEHSGEKCSIAFLENAEVIGVSEFTLADARAAGLAGSANYRKFPKNMLFARALSNGAKWYCPDAFGGGPIYTPDELGAEIDGETGEVVNPAAHAPAPQVTPAPAQAAQSTAASPAPTTASQPAAQTTAAAAVTADPPEPTEPLITGPQVGLFNARCSEIELDDTTRKALVLCITGQPHADRIPQRLLGQDGEKDGEQLRGMLGVLAAAKTSKITSEQLLGELREQYRAAGGALGENTGPLIRAIPDAAIPFDGENDAAQPAAQGTLA